MLFRSIQLLVALLKYFIQFCQLFQFRPPARRAGFHEDVDRERALFSSGIKSNQKLNQTSSPVCTALSTAPYKNLISGTCLSGKTQRTSFPSILVDRTAFYVGGALDRIEICSIVVLVLGSVRLVQCTVQLSLLNPTTIAPKIQPDQASIVPYL